MKISTITKENIKFITVKNDNGLTLVLADYGASIFKIYLNKYLLTRNVANIYDYFIRSIYYGKTIGRVSNRIKGHELEINGNKYYLSANEGDNVLHGGKDGLSSKRFRGYIKSFSDRVEVLYIYKSKHLESGFPGNLLVNVKYIVYNNSNQFDVIYSARSDEDTPISLTNHTYFTLANSNIRSLFLKIRSDKYLSTNEDLTAKEILDVPSYLDFSEHKRIIENIDNENLHTSRLNGYDHYYYFQNKDIKIPSISLENSKIEMNIFTDFEGVQIYTSGFKSDAKLYPFTDELFDSVAIEPSDSFMKLNLVKKNKTYHRTIKYMFRIKN